jgi:hypothetical protein
MQMMEQPFEKLLHHLQTTWHPNCLSYIGPPLHELYSEEEPELTFYDLFMGYCSGKISSRMKKQNPVLLQSALLRQSRMDSFELSESENQNGTVICKEENFAYSAIPTGSHQLADQGLHALRCIWKSNNDLLKSFVCPRGPYDVAVESQDGGVDLIFTLSESIDLSNSKQCREIPFYLTLSNSSKLRIEGESATTFNLVDLVSIDDEPLSISLSFELLEGEGTFLGHILYGNRPSQLKAKGDNRFSAYDKLILLRTVRRSGICRMKAKVRIKARSIL